MSDTVLIGIFSFAGTLAGILASSKLTMYRIQKLEEEVKKHNSLIDRMYKAEQNIALINFEIEDLKND